MWAITTNFRTGIRATTRPHLQSGFRPRGFLHWRLGKILQTPIGNRFFEKAASFFPLTMPAGGTPPFDHKSAKGGYFVVIYRQTPNPPQQMAHFGHLLFPGKRVFEGTHSCWKAEFTLPDTIQ